MLIQELRDIFLRQGIQDGNSLDDGHPIGREGELTAEEYDMEFLSIFKVED